MIERTDLVNYANRVENIKEIYNYSKIQEELDLINKTMEQTDWVNNHQGLIEICVKKSSIEEPIRKCEFLMEHLKSLNEAFDLYESDPEDEECIELVDNYSADFEERLSEEEIQAMLSNEYDKNNAILSIHAGSGGTDAMDWAEKLLRMYMMWTKNKGYKLSIIDVQDDCTAGIKSATLLIEGKYAYGYLKNEKGVHRVVRVSEFDSSGRRHTSFASVDVMPDMDLNIDLDINDKDLRIDTYHSSGAGGQHVNTTDSAVRITHIPTGVVVSCQNERSQTQNKLTAMRVLKSRLLDLARQEQKDKIDELAGDYREITWGSQIRSYVFHPYSLVKDHRTNCEVGNVYKVMDGYLDPFIKEELKQIR